MVTATTAQETSNKQQATAKFKINFSEDTKLTTLVNWFEQKAQDPGGLPRVAVTGAAAAPSAFSDPKGVANSVYNANTRVSRSHTQVGFNLEHKFNESNSLNFVSYIGTRDNRQILAFNADGTNARESRIAREFYGSDLRWNNQGNIFNKPYSLSLGLNYGKSSDARLDTNIQVGGLPANVLNRDEDNISDNFDQYVQGKISVLDNLDIHAGARRTKVKLKVNDNATGTNGDNSGSVEYQKTTPVIGATWKVNPALNFYANFGKGFETPTFIEAAFDNVAVGVASKPNLAIKPSESNNFELGAKAFVADNTQINLTVFSIKTKNEIVTNQTVFGRSSFTNANDTKRTGAELSINSELDNNISLYGAYTLLNAKFDSNFTTQQGNTIESGNRIPGTYKTQLYGEIAWKYVPLGFSSALEGRYNSKVYVDDDINNETAPSYTIFNLRAGFTQNFANWRISEYVRVENMFDKDYIGSVRINDGNQRYYEPAAGRNYLIGLSAQYKF